MGLQIVTAEEVHQDGIARALRDVPEGVPCLVTVDCDGLDPSIMPAVMAAAPGGLSYWNVVNLIQGVARKAPIGCHKSQRTTEAAPAPLCHRSIFPNEEAASSPALRTYPLPPSSPG